MEGPGRHRRQGLRRRGQRRSSSTAGTIGYVELSFAENSALQTAKVENGAGEFAELTAESAGKTIAGAEVTGQGDDLKMSIDYNTKEAGAYPIVLVTYEIVCSKGIAADKLALVKGFLELRGQHRRSGRRWPTWATPRCRRRSAPRSRPRSRASPDLTRLIQPPDTTRSERADG